ncbi:hypothetical protein ACS0TY_010890 [Phlomoides rotata]
MHNFIRTHINVDPIEDDVPETYDDGAGGVDVGEGFIDQVESSPIWTTMRDNLAIPLFDDYV